MNDAVAVEVYVLAPRQRRLLARLEVQLQHARCVRIERACDVEAAQVRSHAERVHFFPERRVDQHLPLAVSGWIPAQVGAAVRRLSVPPGCSDAVAVVAQHVAGWARSFHLRPVSMPHPGITRREAAGSLC